jgi:two-component system chemotaxis response regulator CheY
MKRILVVDDSATVRQQVGMALSQAGFDVVEAANGADGADIIENDPSLATVICDVNMPTMNGIEMLKKVKGNGQHANLPIVMLTTEGSPKLVEQAKAFGAKGWIVKPFKAELLVAAVKKLAGG